mgnify:CR=1 FL=1
MSKKLNLKDVKDIVRQFKQLEMKIGKEYGIKLQNRYSSIYKIENKKNVVYDINYNVKYTRKETEID